MLVEYDLIEARVNALGASSYKYFVRRFLIVTGVCFLLHDSVAAGKISAFLKVDYKSAYSRFWFSQEISLKILYLLLSKGKNG